MKFERIDENTVQLQISLKQAMIIKSLLAYLGNTGPLDEDISELYYGLRISYAVISDEIRLVNNAAERIQKILDTDVG